MKLEGSTKTTYRPNLKQRRRLRKSPEEGAGTPGVSRREVDTGTIRPTHLSDPLKVQERVVPTESTIIVDISHIFECITNDKQTVKRFMKCE